MKVRLLLPAVVFMLVCGLRASEPLSTDGWSLVSTPAFTVVSQLSPKDTQAWAETFSQFFYTIRTRLHPEKRLLSPHLEVLFANRDAFVVGAPVLKSGHVMGSLGGFTRNMPWGSAGGSYYLGNREDTQRIILAGAADWVMSADSRPLPMALRTGISEVFATFTVENNQAILGRAVQDRIYALKRAMANPMALDGGIMHIEALLSVKDINTVTARGNTQIYYSESWAFAHFLMFSREMTGIHAMDRLVGAFAEHLPVHAAMVKTFGDMTGSLEAKFYSYMHGGDFYEVAAPLDPKGSQQIVVQPAPPAFVATALAQLAAGPGTLPLAQVYADRAVALAPNAAASYDAEALVAYADHRRKDSLAAAAHAEALGSTSGWTWFVGAQDPADGTTLVWGTPGLARAAMNDLEKAVKLRPQIERAFVQLSALVGAADHVTDEDGKFLAYGQLLYTENGAIRLGRAQWAHRLHEDALAMRFLDDALAHPDFLRPDELAQAKGWKSVWKG